MGMYTEIFFRADVDEEAYKFFTFMNRSSWVNFAILRDAGKLPDHPFFQKPRAGQLFHGGSAYFPRANHYLVEHDAFSKAVSFRANLKNYDGEIEAFFDWVKPHVENSGFIGYSIYEEEQGHPRLYFTDPE